MKLMDQGPELILNSLDDIACGTCGHMTQDETEATKAPKIFKTDANIDFTQTAQIVHNQIRGMNPFPGSHSYLRGKLVKLLVSRVSDKSCENPGEIIELENGEITVSCGEGSVIISKVAPQGKKAMDTASFIHGYKPKCGDGFQKR